MKVRTVATDSGRVTVLPPPLWPQSRSWSRPSLMRRLIVFLLMRGEPPRSVNLLGVAKQEFLKVLNSCEITTKVSGVVARVERARSLRELWHLRSSVYIVVAIMPSFIL